MCTDLTFNLIRSGIKTDYIHLWKKKENRSLENNCYLHLWVYTEREVYYLDQRKTMLGLAKRSYVFHRRLKHSFRVPKTGTHGICTHYIILSDKVQYKVITKGCSTAKRSGLVSYWAVFTINQRIRIDVSGEISAYRVSSSFVRSRPHLLLLLH